MTTVISKMRVVRCRPSAAGFTLLEVMIALAVLGIALLALLALHHQNLQSVIRARELTQAAMLAQYLMTQAELERFPSLGTSSGNFDRLFRGQYPNFKWQRTVADSGIFPDLRKVTIAIRYGPRQGRRFTLTEFLHSPSPIPVQAAPDSPELEGPGRAIPVPGQP